MEQGNTRPQAPLTKVGDVYKCINIIMSELAEIGIAKDRDNTNQGYKFRGIDDVYNTMAPLLARNKLCVLPRLDHIEVHHIGVGRNQTPGRLVVVRMNFDLVCSDDGSYHTITTAGEGIDTGDKATNKAMSAAYKYAMFEAFAIPTEGKKDSEYDNFEMTPAQELNQRIQVAQDAQPPQYPPQPTTPMPVVPQSSALREEVPPVSGPQPPQPAGVAIQTEQGAIETTDMLIEMVSTFYGNSNIDGLKDFWNQNKATLDALDSGYPEQFQRIKAKFKELALNAQSKVEEQEAVPNV